LLGRADLVVGVGGDSDEEEGVAVVEWMGSRGDGRASSSDSWLCLLDRGCSNEGVAGEADTLSELDDNGAGVKALREDNELVMGGKDGEGVTMMGRLKLEGTFDL